MGNLRAHNISWHGTETYSDAPLYQGIAKAWTNLDGTGTIAAADDFNVTSYVDNTAGNYTINFTNNMYDGNYSSSGASFASASNDSCLSLGSTNTVSALSIYTWDISTVATADSERCCAHTMGVLA